MHAGADQPLLGQFADAAHVHGEDGLAGIHLPKGVAPTPGIACDVIRATLRAGRTTLVASGLHQSGAGFGHRAALVNQVDEIVLMSGAWGEGYITPAAEFNAASDPEALAILLATWRQTHIVPA